MSEKTTVIKEGGVSAFGLLGILFVALKLFGVTEVATWSWLWVLAPFWIGIAAFLAVMVVLALGALLVLVLAAVFK